MSEIGRTEAIGPYEVGPCVASGSTAALHLGCRRGPFGFRRVVAIKRLRADLVMDPDAIALLLEEGRLAAQLSHPLVVAANDVIDDESGVALVIDYVDGLSLAALRNEAGDEWPPPLPITVSILLDVLAALAALHGARGHGGEALGIVHRDVSPKNVLIGADGFARVVDLGVARMAARPSTTARGVIKGTHAYLAPEQVDAEQVDPRTDVFGAGVILWELLTGRRAFAGEPIARRSESARRLLPPSRVVPTLPAGLDAVVRRATAASRKERYASASEFSSALSACVQRASPAETARWAEDVGAAVLADRRALVQELVRSAVAASVPLPHEDDVATASVGPRTPLPLELPAAPLRPLGRRRASRVAMALAAAGLVGWLLGRRAPLPEVAAHGATPTTLAAPLPSVRAGASAEASGSAAAPTAEPASPLTGAQQGIEIDRLERTNP